MPVARYDGETEWYESFTRSEVFTAARRAAVQLLGAGPGRCLDLGCGTGLAAPLLVDTGWTVTGVDASADQLAVAQRDGGGLAAALLVADAHALPFDDGEFDAVVSILTHTDFDDVAAVFREVRRILRPGGRFVYLGVHPCFRLAVRGVGRQRNRRAWSPATVKPAGSGCRTLLRTSIGRAPASGSTISRSRFSSTRCWRAALLCGSSTSPATGTAALPLVAR